MALNLSRQSDIVPENMARQTPVMLIGAGALGRNLAMQLAAMGVTHMTIIDDDVVDETNIATQGYATSHVGKPKVEALKEDLLRYRPDMQVTVHQERYSPGSLPLGTVLFLCADNMETRKSAFFQSLTEGRTRLVVDGRMGGETFRVLTTDTGRPDEVEHYKTTLYTDAQATSSGCTSNMTMYAASSCTAYMCKQYVQWMYHQMADEGYVPMPYEVDLLINLLENSVRNMAAEEAVTV